MSRFVNLLALTANRFYQTFILICDSNRSLAVNVMLSREIDSILAKGKTKSTQIFELIGVTGRILETDVKLIDCSSLALIAYRVQDWDCAEARFRAYLEVRVNNQPSEIFLDRIRNFQNNLPRADWNVKLAFDKK